VGAGRDIQPGAQACIGLLTLPEIEAEFHGLRLTATRWLDQPPELYERVLGPAFAALLDAIRRIHQPGCRLSLAGMAEVEGATGPLALGLAVLFGFPRTSTNVPVSVVIAASGEEERWTRDFDGRAFTSRLSASPQPGRLREKFGPFTFEMQMIIGSSGVTGMPILRWWLGPVALPAILAPVSLARESVDDQGRFRFDVALYLPLRLGRLVRYRGWLIAARKSG
jgi:hypothetical protein